MVEEFRAYGETIDNVMMEELNEEQRDEEESHQHHGDSTYPTKSVTDFLPYIQWLPPSITRRQFVPTPYNSPQLGASAIAENHNWTLLNPPVLRPLRPTPPPPSAPRRLAPGNPGPCYQPTRRSPLRSWPTLCSRSSSTNCSHTRCSPTFSTT
jgi:hypothetical protein